MLKRIRHLTLSVIIFAAACVTINVYFPAAAIQNAADKIADEVTNPKEQKQEKKQDIKSQIFENLRDVLSVPKEAYAQEIDVSTPAIRNIRKSMRENFQQLRPFYVRGSVGENNKGFVEIRDTSSLNVKEKAEVTRLVEQINKDRTSLYAEIVRTNKLESSSLQKVQGIFANSWRKKSQPGWWIQNDDGDWEKK